MQLSALSFYTNRETILHLWDFSSESEVKGSRSVLSTLCNPMDCTVHRILQAKILKWVAFPFSRGSSQPRACTLQVDSLPAEPQEKPKNTGVGHLSLLQGMFPTQESNWGLLRCRQILYQLSYQGSPTVALLVNIFIFSIVIY